jgi:glycosyltransferase involved in cell wall biosynthesis
LLTTFGIPELVDRAKAAGRRRVELLLPPVDVSVNAPGAVDAEPFRRQYDLRPEEITLVTVSRLIEAMKGESLVRTIGAVESLGRELPLRFVLVGGGTARRNLEELAHNANRKLGRPAIILTGPLLDPRQAYAAADIVIGMGGSALRAMAFGKPVIVAGEEGFSAPLTPDTAESFYYNGIYGRGDGDPNNASLVGNICKFVQQANQLSALGEFSRKFIVRHFSLEMISAQLAALYRSVLSEPPVLRRAAGDGVRTAALYLRDRRFLSRSYPPAPFENTA